MKKDKQIGRRSLGFFLALVILLSCTFGATGGIVASAETMSTLYLHTNGGKWSDGSASDKQYTQAAGTTFAPAETPTRNGFVFAGWQFSGSGSWNGSTFTFGSSGSSSHLSAAWQAVQTTLTVDPNGGSWSDGTTLSKQYRDYAGVSFRPERPTRDGYTFQGWRMNSESGAGGTWNGETFVFGNADCMLTAQWYANTYKLTAKPNYGLWIPYIGTPYADAASSVRTYSGTTGSTIDLSPVNLSQYYSINNWTLLSGGSGTLRGPRSYQFGTTNDTVVPQQISGGAAIVQLNPGTGNWKDTNTGAANGVRCLLFDPDYSMTITVNGESKRAYSLPGSADMSKTGHSFAGWTMQNGGSGTVLRQGNTWFYIFDTPDQSSAPQGNAYLTAQWTPVSYTLRLSGFEGVSGDSFWSQYFNGTNLIEIARPYGTTVTLPTSSEITRTGCTFIGWYPIGQVSSQPTGSGRTSFTFTQNDELYACWENNTYTVTVDPNGGYRTILTATSDYKDYDPYTVSTIYGYWLRMFGNEGPIRRDGYRLIGFTGVNGGSIAGSFIDPTENPNLYNNPDEYYYRIGPTDETLVAQWEKIPDDKISVTIGDQISVNLLLDLDARPDVGNVTVTYKDLNGDEKTETFTDFSSLPQVEGGLYRIKVQIAPAQIADTVSVYIDGETLSASVKDYCNTLTEGGYGEEVAALAQAVLDYGQAANNFFNYTEETMSSLANLSADDAKAWEKQLSDTTGKIRNVSFMALTKPEFRFYMRDITEAEAAAYNGKITVSGVSGIASRFVKNAQGSILLEVTGLMAEDMDETITVTIDGLGTITFAGNDFAKLMADNAATEALGAALYAYGAAAKACFKVPTVGDGMEVEIGEADNTN